MCLELVWEPERGEDGGREASERKAQDCAHTQASIYPSVHFHGEPAI